MGREKKENNVLVAMSGGVDSSVTALILKNEGYNVKGAILRMNDAGLSPEDLVNGKLPLSIWHAREAARRIRLDFNIIDVRKEFEEDVIRYFVESYQQGITPNPCVYCNQHMKIPFMLKAAKELECAKIATGHYVIIEYSDKYGRYIMRKSKDLSKDQSYMLYRLSQDDLSRMITPLGSYEKSEIRVMARKARLKNADTPDSQDVCFIPNGDYGAFVERKLAKRGQTPDRSQTTAITPYGSLASSISSKGISGIAGLITGDFVDEEGHVLGQHKGLIHYTIGQRKGLGLSLPEPLYVCEKRLDTNQVVLGKNESLFTDVVRARDVNFVSLGELPEEGMRVSAKIRYSQNLTSGMARMLEDGTLEVRFDEPVRAATPGQSMVLYDEDMVVAGGIII